jgi:upstream activation factor subunit UAF30
VTKRLWKHIKGNDLQDPSDKRYIRCDEAMRNVFKQDRVHMFTMTKLASEQMFPIEE